MGIRQRVERLERAAGPLSNGTACVCRGMSSYDVRYYLEDETSEEDAERDERPPEVCAVCRAPKTLLKVVYAQSRGRPEHER